MMLTRDQLASWTVNDVVRQFPATVALFQRNGIDACCGGALPVREAARRHNVDVAAFLDELQLAVQNPN